MTATLPSLRTTTFAVLLAFALALAVFAATRGDGARRVAGCRLRPQLRTDPRSPRCRPRSAPDGPAARPRSPSPTSRRRARPATSASTPAPSALLRPRAARATRATPARSSSTERSRVAPRLPRRAAAGPPRAGARPGLARAAGRCSSTRSSSSAASAPPSATLQRFVDLRPEPPGLRARVLPARAARRPRRRRARDGAGRRGRRRRARERRLRAGAAGRPRARPRPSARRAARDYGEALAGVPGYVPALAGAGAAGRGPRRPAPARSPRCAASSARLPLPEHVIALGELQLAAGRPRAPRAARSRWSRAEQRAAGRRGRRHGRRDRGLRGRPRLAAAALSRSRAGRGPRRPASAPPTRSAGR